MLSPGLHSSSADFPFRCDDEESDDAPRRDFRNAEQAGSVFVFFQDEIFRRRDELEERVAAGLGDGGGGPASLVGVQEAIHQGFREEARQV